MLICFVCGSSIDGSIKNLFHHLKNMHGVHERNAKYSCRQGQCCRSFSEKYAFSRHISSCHMEDVCDHVLPSPTAPVQDSCSTQDSGATMPATVANAVDDLDITELAALFICEAKSRVTSLSSIHAIVKSCKSMFEKIIDDLKNEVDAVSQEANIDSKHFTRLLNKMHSYRNPFSGIETEYAHIKYLKCAGLYIKPEKYTIGSRQSFVADSTLGFMKPVLEPVYGQYISVGETIKALHSRTSLVQDAIANLHCTRGDDEADVYQSFLDGSQWKEHPLRNSDVILVRLYGDDFEPANPLGSRKSVYKLGCVYFQLESLPTYTLSKTENMFLTLCYHTGDVKEFGWEYVLRPLINELKHLESQGLSLVISGETKLFRVVLSCMTGDNLFLNSILGFVESFTASFPCRHCRLPRQDFHKTVVEVKECLRDVRSYDAATEKVNVQATGIKQKCVFNELQYFHAVQISLQDIMHDVFEGVCAYDLPLICRGLIGRQYFNLMTLNHRLQTFDYGYHDQSNKIPVVTSVDVEMWSFDACQLWSATRTLSLAVGDLVTDENDDIWQLYLLLRNILDLILSPSIVEAQLDLLGTTISEYLQKRGQVFRDSPLKNKHHHLGSLP
jgi:hypothetical protein